MKQGLSPCQLPPRRAVRPGPGRHRPATGPGGPGATAPSPGETAAGRIWRALPRSWDASFAGQLLTATGGAAECLGPDHIWVSRVGRKDLKPGSLAPGSGPLYSDALHGHLLGRSPSMGPGWRRARLCLATGSARDGMSRRCCGRHPKVDMTGGNLPGPALARRWRGDRRGCRARGSGRAAGRGRRPRCGWPRRVCRGGG